MLIRPPKTNISNFMLQYKRDREAKPAEWQRNSKFLLKNRNIPINVQNNLMANNTPMQALYEKSFFAEFLEKSLKIVQFL